MSEQVLFPSTPLMPSPAVFPLAEAHRVRTATLMLCKAIPQHQTGLKKRELEVVRMRMRGLRRLEIVWGQDDSEAATNVSTTSLGAPGNGSGLGASVVEEKAQRLFAKALQDGYLLCQLLNKFWPGSITQIEPCEDGVLRRSNVTKFLDSCSAKGLPPEDLFLPDDLMEGTSHGLTRVAGTIIALIKWAETSAPTGSHSLPDEDNVNPETPSSLRKRPRIKTGAIDPLLVRSAHVAVDTAGAKVSKSPKPSRSTSAPTRTRPTSRSKESKSEKEVFATNQPTTSSTHLSPPTKEIRPSTMNQSTNEPNQSRLPTGSEPPQLANNQSEETSLGGILSPRVRSYSLPTRPRLPSSPTRTRTISSPTRPPLPSSPTRTRTHSFPTRARLQSLPTRTRLLSLQTRTRLLSLQTRARLFSHSIKTPFIVPPFKRVNTSKDRIFPGHLDPPSPRKSKSGIREIDRSDAVFAFFFFLFLFLCLYSVIFCQLTCAEGYYTPCSTSCKI